MSRPELPAVVKKLGWVSLFADICSEMVYPIIPLFVVGALKAPASVLGGIEGAAEALVSFMKVASGVRSDQKGRRAPYIQAGYALSALGKPIIGLAMGWPIVLLGRLTDRCGKGIRTTARDAMIADAVDKDQYGRAFGYHRAMDTAGAVIGVALCGLFVYLFYQSKGPLEAGDYRKIFLVAAVPGAIAWFITMTLRDKGGTPADATEISEKPKIDTKEVIKGLHPSYWRAIVITGFFALANSSDTFLLLTASKLGLSTVAVIGAYALYNVVYMVFSQPAGNLSDRIGRYPILIVGWLIYAGIYGGFATVKAASVIWALFIGYGIYIGLTDGVSKALVADNAPKEAKGTAMGLYYGLTGFLTLGTNLLTGWLYTVYGPGVAFGYNGVMAVVAVASIPLTKAFAK